MHKSVRAGLVVLGLGGLAAVVARQMGVIGGAKPPASAKGASLPLTCRLRGHGWRMPANNYQTPTRHTCPRCQQIDLPMPR